MRLRDFYKNAGIDYDVVLSRLAGSEVLLYKYLKKFVEDRNYDELCQAVACKDYDTALKTAHSIKGMSINLGLEKLYELCAAIVTSIREEQTQKVEPLFNQLKVEYESIASQIERLEQF